MFFFSALYALIIYIIMLIIKTITAVMFVGCGVAVFQERKLWAHDTVLGPVGYLKIFFYPMATMAGTLFGIIAMAPAWIMEHEKGKKRMNVMCCAHWYCI
jgi:predicted small integral membrane protein